MLFVAARAGAAPSAADVEARLALLGAKPAQGDGRATAVTLFFIGQDCPISNAMMPEANRIVEKYAPLGVVFYFVYPENDLTDAEAERHAKDFGMRAPVTVDRERRLVAKAGVKVTPEPWPAGWPLAWKTVTCTTLGPTRSYACITWVE